MSTATSASEQPERSGEATTFDGSSWLTDVTAGMRLEENAEVRQRGLDALSEYVNHLMAQPGQTVSADFEKTLKVWISQIDQKLTKQLNEVMHHSAYQKLEGTWRGLHYLVHQSETGEKLQIRVLNASKEEVQKDLANAVEFDQSFLFKQLYEEEYGTLGGNPYGMLVGDYEFDCKRAMDVKLLENIAGIAAAAHAPFVAAASPLAFNLDSFSELTKPRDLAKIFSTVDYAPWKSFRMSEDSRYTALTMPRVLARYPYGQKYTPVEEFNFEEDVDGTNHDKYQWMSSAWAYATRITDAFSKFGWLARSRGVEGGGKVEGLPVCTFPTDDGDIAMKCPTEVGITERREKELSDLGFLPLIHCKGRDFAAFIGAQSCQNPKVYYEDFATANAALMARFNLILCLSRFAHFLKVMVRNRLGSFMSREDMHKWLNRWINNYTLASPENASDEDKAMRPLQSARVEVQDVPGQPGFYRAQAYMQPHYQLEGLEIAMHLVAKQLGQ